MVKRVFTIVLLAFFACCYLFGAVQAADAKKLNNKKNKNADVILIRGGFDIFSGGINVLSEKLTENGIPNNVVRHTSTKSVIRSLLNKRRSKKNTPIILIGHSWGANEAIEIASELKKAGIQVDYMATFAATAPHPIPNNVKKTTNFYFKSNGWGKIVKRAKGSRGKLENINLSTKKGVHHFNIDEQEDLQEKVIEEVLQSFKGRIKRKR